MDVPVTTAKKSVRQSPSQTVTTDRPINNTSHRSGILVLIVYVLEPVRVHICLCVCVVEVKKKYVRKNALDTCQTNTKGQIITSVLNKTEAVEGKVN